MIRVDSGASKYICNDVTKFITFGENFVSQQLSIQLADGTSMNSVTEWKATAVFQIRDEDGTLQT